ncbi:A24 family peptidase C-terminal domain-containing protein [Staphylothermus hellenicus]|uniref:A24 family peptidase C-terminal domain-containing protein n=1 Tax=Staphylothermus hellenicus TaxID=84599 RepID=UPI0011E522CF|nr:A24 family peptidase C-terminal domain-containing protein [Staphylothermus hellenicus]
MTVPLDIRVLIDLVKIAFSLIVLSIFSIYDIKYRDIPGIYVWFFLGASIVLFIFTITWYEITWFLMSFIVMSLLFGGGVPLALYFLGYMGSADVIAIVSLAFLFPYTDVYKYSLLASSVGGIHVPPIFVIILYSTIVYLVYLPFKIIYVLLVHRDKLPRNSGYLLKLVYLLTGTPMKVSDYLRKKHYYPLMVFKETDQGVKVIYRSSFNVEEDYIDHHENLKRLIGKGKISPSNYIWVTYGIPYIVLLLFGLIMLLIVGDYPLLLFLKFII